MNLKHNMKIALALVVAVGSYLVASGNQCTCEAKPNGCIIIVAAPINKACDCDYDNKLCGASVVNCTVPTASDCINPGTNLKSCLLGGGNCGGYNVSDQRQKDIIVKLRQEMGGQFASQDAVFNKPGPECDGSCVPINQCPILKPVLTAAQNNVASALNTLRRSMCSRAGSQLNVCCPPDVKDPFPEKCGENNGTASIVYGEKAKLGQWPWMALLRMSAGDTHGWFCGGVLISARYVLTAAHCVVDSAYTIEFVRLGELVLNENPDSSGSTTAPDPQDIFVERIIGHPQYNKGCNKCNDIALLRLASPAKIDKLFVKPICISRNPARDGVSASNFRNLKAWVAGWGATQENPFIFSQPSILNTVQLPIQDLEFCRKRKQELPNQNMIFCAGDGKQGKDTCRGDSGGPIMVASNNHVWYSIGVVSFGSSICGADGVQSVFTNINHYLPWIEANLL